MKWIHELSAEKSTEPTVYAFILEVSIRMKKIAPPYFSQIKLYSLEKVRLFWDARKSVELNIRGFLRGWVIGWSNSKKLVLRRTYKLILPVQFSLGQFYVAKTTSYGRIVSGANCGKNNNFSLNEKHQSKEKVYFIHNCGTTGFVYIHMSDWNFSHSMWRTCGWRMTS